MRTGVIQPLPGIGDMVWFLPALRALAAYEGGALTLFAGKSAQAPALFAGEPWCVPVALPPRPRGLLDTVGRFYELVQTLKQQRLDKIYILHRSARYRLAARLAGIRAVFSYPPHVAKESRNGWLLSMAALDHYRIPVADRFSKLSALPAAAAAVRQRYAALPEPWFVVAAGATEPGRMWPTSSFAACIDGLLESGCAATIFVVGAQQESARIAEILAACKNKSAAIASVGLPFEQAVALIAASSGLLGNDSGPANVAAALGVPAYALCGVSKPAAHSPHLRLIEPETQGGMAGIGVAQVLRIIETA